MGNTLTITIPVDRLDLIDKALRTATYNADLEAIKYRLRVEKGNKDELSHRWNVEDYERYSSEAQDIRYATNIILDAIADGLMLARRDIFTYEPAKAPAEVA